jgi:hypothetical protein
MLLLTDDFRLIAEIKATITIRDTIRTSLLLISPQRSTQKEYKLKLNISKCIREIWLQLSIKI